MTMPPPESIVTFMQITGVPEYVAVRKLKEHKCDLTDAINAHFMELERANYEAIFLGQESASRVPDARREEHMFQGAIDALNTLSQGNEMVAGEGSSSQQMGILKDSSDGELPQSYSPEEEDVSLAHAILTSLKDIKNDDQEQLLADELNNLNSISEDEKNELAKKILRDLAKKANVISIVVRMPSGRRIDRIFTKADTVKELFEFVDIVGFQEVKTGTYRLVRQFPRRAYSVEDSSLTFEDADLSEDVALYIEKI